MRCVEEMGISHRDVARALHVDLRRVERMARSTPQLHVLQALGVFIEERARQAVAG